MISFHSFLKRKGLLSLWHIMAFSLLLFPIAIGISLQVCERNARETAEETLAFARARCQWYDNYITGKKTHALTSLQGKATMLADHHSMQNEESIQKFLQDANLTGVVITDNHLRKVYESSPHLYEDFWGVLSSAKVKSIITHPVKSYQEQISIHGKTIEYAVVADEANGNLVLCYEDVTNLLLRRNEIGTDSLFKGYNFRMDGLVVVADDKEILSTNDEALAYESIDESPIPNKEFDKAEKNELVKMDYRGETWYGSRYRYKNLYLYAFFPQKSIYALTYNVTLLLVAFYIALGLLGMYIRYRSTKANMERVEEQLRIIRTISRVYISNVIINLETNTWQAVRIPRHLKDLVAGHERADDMAEYYCRHRVKPEFQEGYREFTDMSTIEERFAQSRDQILTYTFQNQDDVWCLVGLLPKERNKDGKLIEVMALVRSVDDIKKKEIAYQEELKKTAEEASRANLAKTDFLRRMSHDIRTPINGIRGLVRMGDYYKDDLEKQAEYRRKIMDSSSFLLDLINDVLDMNKLESGTITLEEKPMDIRQVFEKTCTLLEPQIGEMHLQFEKDTPAMAHPYVLGSTLHIRQIFQNILSNAVKYNREGGKISVSLKEIPKDEHSSVYELICSDTGVGMDEEFQRKAFEPFSQEGGGARTKFAGTGLGLSIVKKLVTLMGGTITFTSAKGKGTTFRIHIPLPHTDPITEARMVKGESTKPLDRIHILLVEDNDLNMEIARFLLENEKITVTPAWNGEEAVKTFEASAPGTFDMILMDVMMPVMNGLEATVEIRSSSHEDAQTIPIIAVTANAFSDDIARSRSAGMNDHISKPIETEQLFEIIRKYV